ncbi:dTMP kinase [Lysinibacillus sp. UGB7]|uniref:dTMP kinase n=1 Tax=Lysinibacillus sp. UGB7 TaxID=3411039 RepID=UPI003B7CF976
MTKGKIIGFDSGTDGAGKEAQATLLTQALKQMNYNVRHISFPCYDQPSSILVKKYLNGDYGKDAAVLNPYTISTFYAVDRFSSYLEDWKSFYENGGIIILDRYSTSNMIYQGTKFKTLEEAIAFGKWNIDLEHTYGGLPMCDLVLYLDVDPNTSEMMRKNRPNKNQGTTDIHEENADYMKKCYKRGLGLAKEFNWNVVQCVEDGNLKTIDAIHNDILKMVVDFIDK